MAFHSVADIHLVTDAVIKLIEDAVKNATAIFSGSVTNDQVKVTGLAPDLLPGQTSATIQAYLSFYLFHVEVDRFQRNSPVTGPWTAPPTGGAPASRVPLIPQQPLSLNLYYLLSPFVTGNPSDAYVTEQQMMSVGLKTLHENPIIRLSGDRGEFTVATEVETVDEQSRLWQGLTRPLRMSAVYKISVVFIEPAKAPAPLAEPVREIRLDAFPALHSTGAFLGGMTRVDTFRDVPAPGFSQNLTAVCEGETFFLNGLNLDTTAKLILRDAAGTETDVSAWFVSAKTAPPGFTLKVQTAIPACGFYQLLTRAPGGHESNAIPLAIAPLVTHPAAPPADSAIKPDGGGVYTVTGKSFVATKAEVLIGGAALSRVTVAPAAGEFQVVSATKILFKLPAGLVPTAKGTYRYSVRIRVSGVESAPVLYVEVVVP